MLWTFLRNVSTRKWGRSKERRKEFWIKPQKREQRLMLRSVARGWKRRRLSIRETTEQHLIGELIGSSCHWRPSTVRLYQLRKLLNWQINSKRISAKIKKQRDPVSRLSRPLHSNPSNKTFMRALKATGHLRQALLSASYNGAKGILCSRER